MTSDAGALLLTATDRAIGLVERFVDCFADGGAPELVEPTVGTLVGPDTGGAGRQAGGAAQGLRAAGGQIDAQPAGAGRSGADPLPSHRLGGGQDRGVVGRSCFWRRTSSRPSRSLSTSTPPTIRCTAIRRAASFTVITTATAICRCTSSAAPICWRPNNGPPNIDASAGAVEEVARIVAQIRDRWPGVRIVLRADSGFAREALMTWCELNDVNFLFGLAKNQRLVGEIASELAAAEEDSKASGQPARRFKEFQWSTRDSWSRQRRVIAKAEWTTGAANPRFVVTSLSPKDAAPQPLYEEIYCARGDMENRIKECQLDLFADRTSAATMRANQLRLWFAAMAYVLLRALRCSGPNLPERPAARSA
jgi:hypothetical protein